MSKPVRALIVEDSEDDALLLFMELRRHNYAPVYERVDTADAMRAALEKQEWDIILCDYVMPRFSGPKALELMREKGLDLPFIIVSGQIGEDVAVACMKAGAHDYIMKGNLGRLVPAVEREIAEAVNRRERRRAEEALKTTAERLQQVTDTIEDAFWVRSKDARQILYLSPATEKIWGRPCSAFYTSELSLLDTVYPEDRPRVTGALQKHALGEEFDVEYRIVRPDGSYRWIRDRGFPVYDANGQAVMMTGVASDITELRMVNRALLTLSRCNEALVRSASETKLLETVCRIIIEVGGYRMCWVGYPQDDTEKTVLPVARAGYDDGYVETARISWADDEHGKGPTGTTVRSGRPSVVRNTLADSSYSPWRDEARKRGYSSSACFPLLEGGRAFGVINIYAAEEGAFTPDEVALLMRLANDLSHGIMSLRARAERNLAEEKLRALSRRLVQVQDEERRGVARELHDQVGQSLTVLKLIVDNMVKANPENVTPGLDEAQRLTDELISQVRDLSLDLRPRMLDDLGLLPTLVWYLNRFTGKTKIAIDFHHSGLQTELLLETSTTAFRIVQEALTNIMRHAGVKEATVRVWVAGSILWVQIEDKGKGFNPDALASAQSSGLYGMEERARLLGGNLMVESDPGSGTVITARIPLPATETSGKEDPHDNNRLS